MNRGRLAGIILIILGFVVAAIIGVLLASQVDSKSTGVVPLAIGTFLLVIAPLVGVGIYLYVRYGDDADDGQPSAVQKQRALMELLHERGQLQVNEAAVLLGIQQDEVRELVEQLIQLEVFTGSVDWETGLIRLTPNS